MIVVTTPTGHIGSQVVKHLLEANEAVRVIARDPAKLAPEVQAKVEVVQGSTDDQKVLLQALEGAASLFWLVPPDFSANEAEDYYLRFARPAARAIQAQSVQRVVSVSALGRGWPKDAGLVAASWASDAAIEGTGVDFRALVCPGFMENALFQLEPLKNAGAFFSVEPGDVKMPRAATRDIAAMGAKLLLDRSWTGQGQLAVLGPEDLCNDDMAAIMTEVLGQPIRYQQISAADFKAQLREHGVSEIFAQDYLNMLVAKGEGMDNVEPRTPENTTPTSFRQWCEEVLKPAMSS